MAGFLIPSLILAIETAGCIGPTPQPPQDVGAGGICGAAVGQLFGSDHPWNQPVDQAALDPESAAIIAYLLQTHTKADNSQLFRIDGPSDIANSTHGIVVLRADAATPREPFTPWNDYFYSPDCDPMSVPLPVGAAIEGEAGYECVSGGDCHLIVIDTSTCRLHELWKADRAAPTRFRSGCQAVWDLRAKYRSTLRGACCTSADAAGLPIAAHMFSADDLAAGIIDHAIRFVLPNRHIRRRIYVQPATHSTGATSGPASAPPYGARLRLKSTFNDSGFSPGAKIVIAALKKYGMILSDGGNLTFTAANDRFTRAKWNEVGLGPNDLMRLTWDAFEVVDGGKRYTFDDGCDCSRSPLRE